MAKSRSNKFIDTIDECLSNGVKNGIFQVSVEDDFMNGRTVLIEGKPVVNFGSCSYLGIEVDERLKQGAIDATLRYGTQYSSSRAYSSCNLYEELEDLFYKIFEYPAILAMTTTLTHVAAIPIIVGDDDLVILDHQVHGSVQLAVQLVKARGTEVAMIKHNRMDMLEDVIRTNPNKYNKIWYMADGLYSMYGDYAPLTDIQYLMEKYGNFHFYVDDAHGMSWKGKHGNGYVLSEMSLHPKMVLTTSLAKGFGSGGGLVILPDSEMRRKILTCGSSYTVSGPVQPPMLGASIASAKIHLTDEIYTLQNKLNDKIQLVQTLIKEFDLPVVLTSDSPIFYLALGLPRVGYNMVKRLLKEGFFTNIGIFPAVPVKCSGLRLPITNSQTDDDIKNLLAAFKYHFPKVLEEENLTIEDISTNFDLPFEETKKTYTVQENNFKSNLTIQHEKTIDNIDKILWDDLLGDFGNFDWAGCKFLEETFSNNLEVENNWNFHYVIIKDENKKTILATFFTELLCKDDLISPSNVSEQIEKTRERDKFYLVSKVIMMGSLFSEGQHMYIDKSSSKWQKAILEMIRIMNNEKQNCGASMVQIRDWESNDIEMNDFLIKEGFIRAEMPDAHIIDKFNWNTDAEFLNTLSAKSRLHVRKNILPHSNKYIVKFITDGKYSNDIGKYYELYEAVKKKNLDMNTFHLPIKLFENAKKHPNWELLELSIYYKNEIQLASFGLCYKTKNNYCPMVIGLNYELNTKYNSYRQNIFQVIKRAKEIGMKKIYLGMGASLEKTRLGAYTTKKSVFIQTNDNYKLDLLSQIKNEKIYAIK